MARRKTEIEPIDETEPTEETAATNEPEAGGVETVAESVEGQNAVIIGDGGAVFIGQRVVAVSSAIKSVGVKHSFTTRGTASPALAQLLDTAAGKTPSICLGFPDRMISFDDEYECVTFKGSLKATITGETANWATLTIVVKIADDECPFLDLAALMKRDGILYMLPIPVEHPDLFEGELAPQVSIHHPRGPVVLSQAKGSELKDAVMAVIADHRKMEAEPEPEPDEAPLLDGLDGEEPGTGEQAYFPAEIN